jgi:hypothetical protein
MDVGEQLQLMTTTPRDRQISEAIFADPPRVPPITFVVVDDEGVEQPSILPPAVPEWAMDLDTHHSTMQRTATYRCTDPECGGEHEEYRQNPRALPYAKVCGCFRTIESGEAVTCTAPALRRVTYPGEGVALNARRFEPLCVYERANYDAISDDRKRSLDKYYIPGRNNEPTEPGMIRHELTNMAEYNRFIKGVNEHETQKMRDHRSMHEEYFKARRKAMRADVDSRVGPMRSHPLIAYLRRAMRARSDAKSARRYGKPLDAHFHAQLLEFNQSNMQDWCAEDSGGRRGWQSRRAR